MNDRICTALFTDKQSKKVIYRLTEKNPWNKFYWEQSKAKHLERLSRLHEISKGQIDIQDSTVWYDEKIETA